MNETHNDYLQFTSEMGIFSLAALLVLLLFYSRNGTRYLLFSKNMYLLDLTLGCTVSIAGVALHGSMDFPFQIPANAFAFWVILGLTVSISRTINLHEVKGAKVSERISQKSAKWIKAEDNSSNWYQTRSNQTGTGSERIEKISL